MKTIVTHWKRIVLWGGVSLIYLLPFFNLPIFSAMYMKIEFIPGESTDEKHKEWIEILSVSQKVTVPITSGGAGAPRTAGTPQVSDFTVASLVNIASPQLFFQAVSGASIPAINIEVTRDVAGVSETYLKIELKDVLISSYQTSGSSGGDVPTESVSLNYGKIEFKYQQFDDKTGAPGGTSTGGYDVDNKAPF